MQTNTRPAEPNFKDFAHIGPGTPAGALLRLRVRVPGLPVNFFHRAPAAAM